MQVFGFTGRLEAPRRSSPDAVLQLADIKADGYHLAFRIVFGHQKPQMGLMTRISCLAHARRTQQAAIVTAPQPGHTDLGSRHLLEVSEAETCKIPAIRQGFRWRSKMF